MFNKITCIIINITAIQVKLYFIITCIMKWNTAVSFRKCTALHKLQVHVNIFISSADFCVFLIAPETIPATETLLCAAESFNSSCVLVFLLLQSFPRCYNILLLHSIKAFQQEHRVMSIYIIIAIKTPLLICNDTYFRRRWFVTHNLNVTY